MSSNASDDSTGGSLPPLPRNWEELGRSLAGTTMDPELRRHYEWINENRGPIDPERYPPEWVDIQSIASAGWGVIFGSKVSSEVKEALQPLLLRRKDQAGAFYKEFVHRGEGKFKFLSDHRATRGIADPNFIPYYLLIVGDPSDVSFKFQSLMDLEYGVGRIHFGTLQHYKNYVKSVLAAEDGAPRPPKEVTFFGASQDDATRRTLKELVIPLAEAFKAKKKWPVHEILGKKADRESLRRLLRGENATELLVTASHGMRFPGHELQQQLAHQGALLCDAAHPESSDEPVPREAYFSGADVDRAANLRGVIACLFACYSAGTPEFDSYREASLSPPPRIAERPFVSSLAQQLLGYPDEGGALAVLGHIDRMWSTSFSWNDFGQIGVYESILRQLLKGYPAGAATEYFGFLHASHGSDFGQLIEDRENLEEGFDAEEFARSWCAFNDARNFVLLGDPAVRLPPGD